MITVYHGRTEPIETPICKFGRRNLDFGQGFYLTPLREQALAWANNMARSRKQTAVLNRYRLDREFLLRDAKYRVFAAYDEEWLAFIVGNRSGLNPAAAY